MENVVITIETENFSLRTRGTNKDTARSIAQAILALVRGYDEAMYSDVGSCLRRELSL